MRDRPCRPPEVQTTLNKLPLMLTQESRCRRNIDDISGTVRCLSALVGQTGSRPSGFNQDQDLPSAAVGAEEPNSVIFQHVMRFVGAAPAHLWMIGDNPVADIQGARQAGLSASWPTARTPTRSAS